MQKVLLNIYVGYSYHWEQKKSLLNFTINPLLVSPFNMSLLLTSSKLRDAGDVIVKKVEIGGLVKF